MNLEEAVQLLADGVYQTSMRCKIEMSEIDKKMFEILHENEYYYQCFLSMKLNYSHDSMAMYDLIIFLICLTNDIQLKPQYFCMFKIQDLFISRYMENSYINKHFMIFILDNYEHFPKSLKLIAEKACKMNLKYSFTLEAVILVISESNDDKIKEYLLDNIESCDLHSAMKYDGLVSLDGLLKRNKIFIKSDITQCIFVYILINNSHHRIIDIALKCKSTICSDKLDFVHHGRSLNTFRGKFYIPVNSLDKLSSLENFDDFLKNNYEFFTQHCNEECSNYVKNHI